MPFLLLLLFLPLTLSQPTSCPLNFTLLAPYVSAAAASGVPSDTPTRCTYALQGLHFLLANYLLSTSSFLPPPSTASACISAYQSLISPVVPPPFSLTRSCAFSPTSLLPCMNITTKRQFQNLITPTGVADISNSCGGALSDSAPCTGCTTALNRIKSVYLPGPDVTNITDCTSYPFIYAAAVNQYGPDDKDTALCLFLLNSNPLPGGDSHRSPAWVYGVAAGCVAVVVTAAVVAYIYWRRWRERERIRRRKSRSLDPEGTKNGSRALESMAASTSLIKFEFEDIKAATNNFNRDNIIGRGGFGNVYRGMLEDGTEVALKRFKNCSAAGDASFAHEVEVIASVRHVNLMALRGYCMATTQMEGHQRIIVCDLMHNGSLHDHLFGDWERKLSWPVRQRIALGTARGLEYLHYGARPSIFHRDIKANNILLDEMFEAKVADFGLAKFSPEGVTHVSTRVAGTLGYVAPEYALYGQLTERTDVYSFGVVLLELLSGRKAFVATGDGQQFLLAEWGWALVRKGRALDVIEEGMEELGPKEVLEKYVHLAVLCSHPEMHARPTMDEVVKILETDVPVPSIPDRPLPLTSSREEIERSISSSDSSQLSSLAGFQLMKARNDDTSFDQSETL